MLHSGAWETEAYVFDNFAETVGRVKNIVTRLHGYMSDPLVLIGVLAVLPLAVARTNHQPDTGPVLHRGAEPRQLGLPRGELFRKQLFNFKLLVNIDICLRQAEVKDAATGVAALLAADAVAPQALDAVAVAARETDGLNHENVT